MLSCRCLQDSVPKKGGGGEEDLHKKERDRVTKFYFQELIK